MLSCIYSELYHVRLNIGLNLLLLLALLSVTNTHSKDEEDDFDLEDGSQISEDDIDNIMKKYKDFDGMGGGIQRLKDLILQPQKVIDAYNTEFENLDIGTIIKKKFSKGKNPEEFLNINSKSESLEFIIDHYNRAVQTEKELDKLLINNGLLEKHLKYINETKVYTETFKRLTKRAQVLKKRAESHDIDIRSLMIEIKRIHDEKSTFVETNPFQFNTIELEEVEAFQKQKDKMHDEVNKFSAMKDEWVKHLMGFRVEAGVELNDPQLITAIRGEVVSFDITLLEKLLKHYQHLEGLMNNLELEKNAKNKLKISEEIKLLEETVIPNYIEAHENEINRFLPSTTGIVVRGMKKMLNVDKLYQEITQLSVEINELLKEHIEVNKAYILAMEDAAIAFNNLKDEL